MFLTAIVAMDRKGLIGSSGKIPWHLPSDLKRFRRLTMGKPVIMGRKTWESLPGPLEGRTNIVMSRPGSDFSSVSRKALVATTRDWAYSLAGDEGYEASVIGGAAIYSEFIRFCRRIHLTLVESDNPGDAYFPAHLLEGRYWEVAAVEIRQGDNDEFRTSYVELIEKKEGSGGGDIWNWINKKNYQEATGR